MNNPLFFMCLVVGIATYAFRFGPTKLNLKDLPESSPLSRFLVSTGPAAIATLFVASVLPAVRQAALPVPLLLGIAAVFAVFYTMRSVVAATLAGAAAYGVVFALMGSG
jgi:branched-subunit amino acid transport protein